MVVNEHKIVTTSVSVIVVPPEQILPAQPIGNWSFLGFADTDGGTN